MGGRFGIIVTACLIALPVLAEDVILEGARDPQPDRVNEGILATDDEQRLNAVRPKPRPTKTQGVRGLAAEAVKGRDTKAISGDTILFLGHEVRLADLTCPSLDTEDGLRAKALMNTMLRRSGHFECKTSEGSVTPPRAHCTVAERKGLKGRNVTLGMIQSGLCWAGDAEKGEGA